MSAAVIYTRVSTEDQASKEGNLETQEKLCLDFAARQGFAVVAKFCDAGVSGRSAENRPEFQKMLAYCRKHHKSVDAVIVSSLSRFARNIGVQVMSMNTLRQLDIEVLSVSEPVIGNTAVGKLASDMLGSFNEFFSNKLSEDSRVRSQAAVARGQFPWSAPIGYLNHKNGNGSNLAVDHNRAPFVQRAFSMLLDDQRPKEILDLLNSLGFTTRKGNTVPFQTFSRIIRNPVYAGIIQSGDLRVLGTHEPLITEPCWKS